MAANIIRCPGCGANMDLSVFPVRPDQVVCPRCQTRCAVPSEAPAFGAAGIAAQAPYAQQGMAPVQAPQQAPVMPGQPFVSSPYATQQPNMPIQMSYGQPVSQVPTMQLPQNPAQAQMPATSLQPQMIPGAMPQPANVGTAAQQFPVQQPAPVPEPAPTMATVPHPAAGQSASSLSGEPLQPVIEPIAPLQLGSLGEPVMQAPTIAFDEEGYGEPGTYEAEEYDEVFSSSRYGSEVELAPTTFEEPLPLPSRKPAPDPVSSPAATTLLPKSDTSGLDKSTFFEPLHQENPKEKVFLLPIDAKGNTEPLAFAVLGLLSTVLLFPLLGMVLCIIALSMNADEKRHNLYNSHRGLSTLFAVLGLVANIAVLAVWVLVIVFLGMTPAVVLGYFL